MHNVIYEHLPKRQMQAWHLPEWLKSDPRMTVTSSHPPVCAKGRSITYQSCRYLRDLGYTGQVNFIRQSDGMCTHFVRDLAKGASLDTGGVHTYRRRERGDRDRSTGSREHSPAAQGAIS